MKRHVLVKHLKNHDPYLSREGRRHSILQQDHLKTEVPRHREIVDELARKICRELEIPFGGRTKNEVQSDHLKTGDRWIGWLVDLP
jgi:hypothetical protein